MIRSLVFAEDKTRRNAAGFVESSIEIQNGYLLNTKLGSVLPEERRDCFVGVFTKVSTCFAVECVN
jgi:hypothetical protein